MTPLCQTWTLEERKQRVHDLVERFTKEKSFYTSKSFKEAETRLNFIDPFLECLGWDVKNEEGKTESFKNVKVETNQIQGQNVKHPDYALRLGMGQTVLYVEAKQPSINLKDAPEPALQVRRYGYTSKLNLSLLTDFEELSVYDTTIKPKPTDKVRIARIEYYTYDKYEEKFEEIYNKYSYEACNSGKMTFFAESSSNKKGTASIDDDILQMIEEWRLLLANDIALNNQTIDEYDLTGAIQKIIDRIIFLRICEDKSVEEYGMLKEILEPHENSIYSHLKLFFNQANDKYNAGLFAKDDYIDSITVSDKTLTKMIKSLYYPECQYEWSVLPVEILGTIYERFLGKIIQFSRKTKNGHNITVIEKPEVQKAGGVYYTPGYIVQYIVEQTIGAKIKDKTPEQISKMRFVDPACGSGSFLVGAYDYLLRYHLDYYVSEKNKVKSEKNGIIYKDAQTGEYKLSIAEKRRILVNNIYGVDLDLQATEVSKVSLFLKLLENEGRSLNTQGQGEMFKTSDLAQEKILPFMGNNIKCGNSLVGTDFVNPGLFESKEEFVKVRPFDWNKEFGGMFDCVIGNPPYMRVQTIAEFHPKIKEYYETHYTNSTKGSYDLANVFLEKELNLLKADGIGGIIFPHKFLNTDNGIEFRNFLMKEKRIFKLSHFGANMVFDNADTYTCIPIFNGQKNEGIEFQRFAFKSDFKNDLFDEYKYAFMSYKNIEKAYKLYGKNMWILFDHKDGFGIFEKIYKDSQRIEDVFSDFFVGLQTSNDKLYILQKQQDGSFIVPLSGKCYTDLELDLFKPFLMGKDVQQWCKLKTDKYVFFPYNVKDGVATAIPLNELKEKYPKTFEYVKDHEKDFKARERGKAGKMSVWYAYIYPKNLTKFEQPKLTSMEICANHPNVTLNLENYYHTTKAYSWVKKPDIQESYEFFLAIANSNLIWWFLKTTGDTLQGDARTFKTAYLNPFPLKKPTQEQHDNLATLVDQMLQTQSKLHDDTKPLSPSDKQFLEQKVAMLDAQINTQVYKLYGLTKEEIAVVEGR